MWGIKTRRWRCQGFHQTGDSNPVLGRWVRTGWNSILEDSYKDGHWNKELVDFRHGFMVSPVTLSYNFLKLVYPFSCSRGTARLMLQVELKKLPDCSEGVVAGIQNQEGYCTATDWWRTKRHCLLKLAWPHGGPVVRTQRFHCRGHRFYLWSGTKITQARWCSHKYINTYIKWPDKDIGSAVSSREQNRVCWRPDSPEEHWYPQFTTGSSHWTHPRG